MKAVLISAINLLLATLLTIATWNLNSVVVTFLSAYFIGYFVVSIFLDTREYVGERYLVKQLKKHFSVMEKRHDPKEMD